jgi:CheY-like chemotaxis protein
MHILLVEDDAICREVVGTILQTHGNDVTSVATGTEAIALLDDGLKPDLLLTDILLPGDFDGWTVARVFQDEIPRLPVVYLTATLWDVDPVSNSIYLLKPVRPELLMQAIRAIAPAPTGARSLTRLLH